MEKNQFLNQIISVAEKLSLGILKFQEELYYLSNSNLNENELKEIYEDIKYIVGVLTLELLAINNILDKIKKDEQFYSQNKNELNEFLLKVERYCSKYDLTTE